VGRATLVSSGQTNANTGENSSEVAMRKQASITTILMMTFAVLVGTLTAQRALLSSQRASDTQGFKEFHDRVEAYEKLHKEAEKSLPKLKKKDKAEAIAVRQEALVNKIRELRSNARQGDIFTPSATEAITRTIKAVFAGPGAREVRKTIQAGEPLKGFEVQVNQRYPDNMPFTTVPPTLLRKLPELPEEVVYRILGPALLLIDRKANMIIDFIPNAIH
jgi:hypothetical protein